MEFTPITIGVLIAVWVVGYLLGLAEAAIKNDNKEKKKEEEALPVEDGEEGALSAPAPNVLEPEALAVFERLSGALKLRIDGRLLNINLIFLLNNRSV